LEKTKLETEVFELRAIKITDVVLLIRLYKAYLLLYRM